MFVPVFIKAVLAIVLILALGLFFVISENVLIIPIVMILSYLSTKNILCPKCKKSLFKTKENKLNVFIKKTCDKCGENLI
ncbi:MAG: hypothetical protein HRT41_08490 [Campylobacteraceae bacterium]|nr:hypothetical protein [Campylobacteraceae bacterium]